MAPSPMPRPIAALFFCLSCLVDIVALVAARELHVLNTTVLSCTSTNANAACNSSSNKTKLSSLQTDFLTIYANDGGSSRLVSYKSSDLPQAPGLVEWVAGKQRRLVGSHGSMQRPGGSSSGSSKGERAVIGTDDRFHPEMGDPYDKVVGVVQSELEMQIKYMHKKNRCCYIASVVLSRSASSRLLLEGFARLRSSTETSF